MSPDGRHVVFVSTRGGGTADLWILDLNSLAVRPLTSGAGGDFRPVWSPDGNWIAFSSDRASDMPMGRGRWEHLDVDRHLMVRPDGKDLKRFKNDGHSCGSPKWSRDSKQIVAYCAASEDMLPFRAPRSSGETRLIAVDASSGDVKDLSVGAGIKVAPGVLPSGIYGLFDEMQEAREFSTATARMDRRVKSDMRPGHRMASESRSTSGRSNPARAGGASGVVIRGTTL